MPSIDNQLLAANIVDSLLEELTFDSRAAYPHGNGFSMNHMRNWAENIILHELEDNQSDTMEV